MYVYVRICIGRKCGLRRRWKLRVGTRQSTRNPKNVSTGETYQRLSIAGLHVTSQQSCWRCVWASLSSGSKPYFHVNFSRKKLHCIWPPTHHRHGRLVNWYHNFSENRSSLFMPYPCSKQKKKKHFKSLPHYISIFYLFISLFSIAFSWRWSVK